MSLLDILKWLDSVFSSVDQWLLISLYCLAISFAALMNKSDNNTLLLIGVILALKLLGIFYIDDLLFYNKNISNTMFHFYHSLIDVLSIAAVFFRVKIFILLVNVTRFLLQMLSEIFAISVNKNISINLQYRRHIEEYKLILVFVASIVINLLMMAEYQIRLSGHKQVLFVYYLYTPAKVVLTICLAILIFKVGYQAKKVFVKE